MADVSVTGVSKSYGAAKALDDVTIDFENGGFFGLLGPSGSGKTTLLRAIAGFVFPDSGSIMLDGRPVENIPVEKRGIGMVFQSYALFPNMSVFDNIGFGLRVRRVGAAEEARRIGQALELVQLGDLARRKPHQLSGGQRQRVALARAIVTDPRVLLLDEPLSALDKALRVEMQIELKRIQQEIGITTVFVTHDQEEALTLSDRIGILKDGRLVQTGAPREVYNNPVDQFTAGFLGDANLLPGEMVEGRLRLIDGTVIRVPDGGDPSMMFAVRPENVWITRNRNSDESLNQIRGELMQRIFAGATATCLIRWQSHTFKVVARERELSDLPEAGPVWLSWTAESMMAFRR